MFLDSPLKIYCYAIATPVFEMLRKYGVKCTYRTIFERKSSVFDGVESRGKGSRRVKSARDFESLSLHKSPDFT